MTRAGLHSLVLVVSLVLTFSPVSYNQSRDERRCMPPEARNPDGNYIVPGVRGDIVYRRVDGRELSLDAYVQKRGERRPAVLVVHGGRWTSGSRIAFVGQFLEMLTRAGFNWFSVDYRLGGPARHADALEDLRAALAFVRCRAEEFRIDPGRIALLGEDAGAHLAALLASERPEGVRAAVLAGGYYDLRRLDTGEIAASPDLPAEASPVTRSWRSSPDLLVVHGSADREVPPVQAEQFCRSVQSDGADCRYVSVPGASHRPENWWPEQWGYKRTVTDWLSRKLGLQDADHEPYSTRLEKDIVYDAAAGLKLDAWIPAGSGPFPAVILVHGGGWEAGDKVTYLTPLFEPLSRAGFAWFSIDYRLTPMVRHEEQLEDLRSAIRFVRANAGRFDVDPGRLAIVGESAGGQMVTRIAVEANPGVAAVVSLYGVYDFVSLATDASPRSIADRLFGIRELNEQSRALMSRHSPIYHVNREMPPLLLVNGTGERLWAQALAMQKRLREAGVEHELYALDGAPHGMENWEGRPE